MIQEMSILGYAKSCPSSYEKILTDALCCQVNEVHIMELRPLACNLSALGLQKLRVFGDNKPLEEAMDRAADSRGY